MSIDLLKMYSAVNEHSVKEFSPQLVIFFKNFRVCLKLISTYKDGISCVESFIDFDDWKAFNEELFKIKLDDMHSRFLNLLKEKKRLCPDDK